MGEIEEMETFFSVEVEDDSEMPILKPTGISERRAQKWLRHNHFGEHACAALAKLTDGELLALPKERAMQLLGLHEGKALCMRLKMHRLVHYPRADRDRRMDRDLWTNSCMSGLNFAHGRTQRVAIQRRTLDYYTELVYSNLRALRLDWPSLVSPYTTRRRPHVSCTRFDAHGCLLAVASTTGAVAIHDFDVVLSKWCTHKQKGGRGERGSGLGLSEAEQLRAQAREEAAEAQGFPMEGVRTCPVGRPVVELETRGFSVDNIRWNPDNENEIALVSSRHNSVYMYDIARGEGLIEEPTVMLGVKPSAASGTPAP
jgi:hypothetical protein